jgi:hypothetical protein
MAHVAASALASVDAGAHALSLAAHRIAQARQRSAPPRLSRSSDRFD